MKTSFHIHGFWHHVTWDEKGKRGKDQHGRIWLNALNPVDDSGFLKAGPQEVPQLSKSKLFV